MSTHPVLDTWHRLVRTGDRAGLWDLLAEEAVFHAVLEFEVEIDGIVVNGVDMITWNQDHKIVEFKVMIRPLKAINLLHQKMAQQLEASR